LVDVALHCSWMMLEEEISWGWRFLVVNPDWFCYEVMTGSKIQQVSWWTPSPHDKTNWDSKPQVFYISWFHIWTSSVQGGSTKFKVHIFP
jgi:hypothetical protein